MTATSVPTTATIIPPKPQGTEKNKWLNLVTNSTEDNW